MEKVIQFLINNDYWEESEKDSGYRTFFKDDVSAIDVYPNEIVFIGEQGDFLNIPVNIYALIGALLHFRQLAIDYKF